MLFFTGILCIFCDSLLKLEGKRPKTVTIYTSRGSFQAQHVVKICHAKRCRAHYHYSFFTKYQVMYNDHKLAKFFYHDSLQKEYFFTSSSTAFETEYLRTFYSDMVLCPESSFHQKADYFNMNAATGNIN